MGEESEMCTPRFRRGIGDSMHTRGKPMQHGKPRAWSSATKGKSVSTLQSDSIAVGLIEAIHNGNIESLQRVLAET